MAINYTNLFEDIGEFVERINAFVAIAETDLPAYESEIDVELTGNGRYDILSGVPALFEGFQDDVVSWSSAMGGKVEERLIHRTTILDELVLSGDATALEVLLELYRDMVDNSEDILESAVTIGAVSSDIQGDSDGTVLTSKILDGVSTPSSGWPICPDYMQDLTQAVGSGRFPGEHANYQGTLTQLCVKSETMDLTCTADDPTDGTGEGSETFDWIGGLVGASAYDWKSQGSGVGPQVTLMNGAAILQNGEFETFTINTPANWDVDDGTAGTHIFRETTIVKRGDCALKLLGDGSQATIKISQTITDLTPGKRYVVGCWVQGEAATAAGTLTIQFEGTGYVAGINGAVEKEQIQLNAAALAAQTTYAVESFFFNVPQVIPADFELVIKVTGTLTSGKAVYIDGLALAEAAWHGGMCIGILAGVEQFVRGDRFTFTVANDDAGKFQTFFRRWFKHQLPSDASPSISDSLASD